MRDAGNLSPEVPCLVGPIVLAHGAVDGTPWQVDAAVTGPTPEGNWWDHGPVGPSLAFSLGVDGSFGGGGGTSLLNEGTYFTAHICFFGSRPRIVAWYGVVSSDVASLEVRLDDGDRRPIAVHDVPLEGFDTRAFWFFPPRGATGAVVAISSYGAELQREELIDVDVPPRANSGTGVNGFGWQADRPPPGWPEETRSFAPGEGPRSGEDYFLHEAGFPLYVVPPQRWTGWCGMGGSSHSGRTLTAVAFTYLESDPRAGTSSKGFEVVNEGGREWPFRRAPSPDDIGIWWDEMTDDVAINFGARFMDRARFGALTDGRGSPSFGPLRLDALHDLEIAGRRVSVALRRYPGVPELVELWFELPPTTVALLGWNLSPDELEGYAMRLERLELGTELFEAMTAAEGRSSP